MSVDLPICQSALTDKNQESNQGKEQAYSSNSAVLKLWKAIHPACPRTITMQAKDLGITQRPVHRKSLQRLARMATLQPQVVRINRIPCSRSVKKQLLGGGVQASTMYGCEVDPFTQAQNRTTSERCCHCTLGRQRPQKQVCNAPPHWRRQVGAQGAVLLASAE